MFGMSDATESLRQMSVPLAKKLSISYTAAAATREQEALVELVVYPGVTARSVETLESDNIKKDLKDIFPTLTTGERYELKKYLRDNDISFKKGRSTCISRGFDKGSFGGGYDF